MADSIPVIDLQDFPGNLTKLIKASEEWGCFRIVNFDSILPVSLMYEMKSVVASLLELPLEIKQRNVDIIAGSGYRIPGRINPIHEGLGLYDIASSQAVDAFCTQLDATPQQRDTITRYAQGVNELIKDMGRKLGEGLGLTDVPFGSWPSQFRINKYPFTPESIGSDGLRTHMDNGFLTIVQDDEQFGGLEVMRKSGEFVAVEPCPGTLLINFGDIATVSVEQWEILQREAPGGLQASRNQDFNRYVSIRTKGRSSGGTTRISDSRKSSSIHSFQFEEFRNTRFYKHMNAGEALDLFRVES
ncbi:hypothetical protein BUALT_Bualt16G0026300 [Buddleja alternifolia]|uniref:Fe2OG dioxygenase domain-containing protein n=1 Tax=Buddleja alternifolia TaxID=168488 RepID=A0AAV6WGU9_9LAMI|nr:hypothetical protein BUALT_Bualt16G0026300 [Buddleja alternifolia]